jgi:hypothetical protein
MRRVARPFGLGHYLQELTVICQDELFVSHSELLPALPPSQKRGEGADA